MRLKLFKAEETKISLLKGYLFSHILKKKHNSMQKYRRALAGPTTYHSARFDQASHSFTCPGTHTYTYTRLLHADTCKNICPNTKIGPQRLHLHLCSGPHLHTGVRMWHIHTERKKDRREGGGKRERGESHYCGRPKSFSRYHLCILEPNHECDFHF